MFSSFVVGLSTSEIYDILDQRLAECNSFEYLFNQLVGCDVSELRDKKFLQPLQPVSLMLPLSKPTIESIFNTIKGDILCEWKYDGERIQVFNH